MEFDMTVYTVTLVQIMILRKKPLIFGLFVG
jgi:hypothetical protein